MGRTSYADFCKLVHQKTGLDLASYKPQQMQRRIQSLMHTYGLDDFGAFFTLLEQDEECYHSFLDRLTINVTEFMRNPDYFRQLGGVVLPRLRAQRQQLRIWSAGCANGAEIYTVALLLAEQRALTFGTYLLGTDIDAQSLKEARLGVYKLNDLRNLDPTLRKRFFLPHGEDAFQLREAIRKRVQFKAHNLLQDPFEEDFDLILCRNVVIYFTSAAKDALYKQFYQALRPGGILMVGATEPLLQCAQYGYRNLLPGFYEKPG